MIRQTPQNQRVHVRSHVCAAASVEHLSEVVRHVGLHGLKTSASRFKEPRSRGLWGDPDPDLAALRSGASDRPAVDPKPFSGNTCAAQTPSRNNIRFIAAFFI